VNLIVIGCFWSNKTLRNTAVFVCVVVDPAVVAIGVYFSEGKYRNDEFCVILHK